MWYSMTVVYLTNFYTVMRYVTISFKLNLCTKHIIVYSTMHDISFKVLWWKLYQIYYGIKYQTCYEPIILWFMVPYQFWCEKVLPSILRVTWNTSWCLNFKLLSFSEYSHSSFSKIIFMRNSFLNETLCKF